MRGSLVASRSVVLWTEMPWKMCEKIADAALGRRASKSFECESAFRRGDCVKTTTVCVKDSGISGASQGRARGTVTRLVIDTPDLTVLYACTGTVIRTHTVSPAPALSVPRTGRSRSVPSLALVRCRTARTPHRVRSRCAREAVVEAVRAGRSHLYQFGTVLLVRLAGLALTLPPFRPPALPPPTLPPPTLWILLPGFSQ